MDAKRQAPQTGCSVEMILRAQRHQYRRFPEVSSSQSVQNSITRGLISILRIPSYYPGVDKLFQDKVALGADASAAAGPVGRDARAMTDAQISAQILSYSRAQGLFAGLNLTGGVLRPDKDANVDAYGANASPEDVINGTAPIQVHAAARQFIDALGRGVRATTGRK